jgi:peptidoglycan/LPS O-acetylase OafA/YrhL
MNSSINKNNPQKLEWLQVLRAIAAIAVLLFHARPILPNWPILQKPFSQGFFGVDIFFCLSGYVICATCERKNPDLPNGMKFIAERLSRIYLGYWPIMFLAWVLAWFGIRPIDNIVEKSIQSILLLSVNMSNHWLEVAWSLAYEIRFYIAISILYFILKLKISFTNILFISMPFLLYGLYFYTFRFNQVVGGVWPLREPLSAFYLEFCFGVYIYKLNQSRELNLNQVLYFGVLASLLISVASFNIFLANFELLRAGTYGIAAMLILAIFLAIQNSGWRANKIFVAIGDSSYSLYLLHPLLLTVVFRFNTHFHDVIKWMAIPLLIVIVILSYLWYFGIEKRIYKNDRTIIYSKNNKQRTRQI